MKIEYIQDKGSRSVNEDSILITGDTFGVFDGATNLSGYVDGQGVTGGLLASRIAKSVFEKDGKSLEALALEANRVIKQEMISRGIETSIKNDLWGTTAAVIKLDTDHFEWLRVCDSLIIVVRADGTFELLGEYVNHNIETLRLWKDYADRNEKSIYEKVQWKINNIRQRSNIDYGVINGEDELKRFIQKGRQPLAGVKHIIIFTDGMFLPSVDPDKECDWELFVKIYIAGGLKNIQAYIRNMELNDPNCWQYPRLKQHDDMSAISITL